jgi:hypothetical protein
MALASAEYEVLLLQIGSGLAPADDSKDVVEVEEAEEAQWALYLNTDLNDSEPGPESVA